MPSGRNNYDVYTALMVARSAAIDEFKTDGNLPSTDPAPTHRIELFQDDTSAQSSGSDLWIVRKPSVTPVEANVRVRSFFRMMSGTTTIDALLTDGHGVGVFARAKDVFGTEKTVIAALRTFGAGGTGNLTLSAFGLYRWVNGTRSVIAEITTSLVHPLTEPFFTVQLEILGNQARGYLTYGTTETAGLVTTPLLRLTGTVGAVTAAGSAGIVSFRNTLTSGRNITWRVGVDKLRVEKLT